MTGNGEATQSVDRSQYVTLLVVGLVAVLFMLIPATRQLALGGLWIGAPAIAFGTLLNVFRGARDIRSGRGIIFAMVCAAVTVVAIPFGTLAQSSSFGKAFSLLGFVTGVMAILVSRLATSTDVDSESRDIPPAEEFDNVNEVFAEHESSEPGNVE